MKILKFLGLLIYKIVLIPCIAIVFTIHIIVFIFSRKLFYQLMYDTATNGLSELGINPNETKEL